MAVGFHFVLPFNKIIQCLLKDKKKKKKKKAKKTEL